MNWRNIRVIILQEQEFYIYIIQGSMDDYRISFSGKNDLYPNYMDNFKFFEDCFISSKQSISYYLFNDEGIKILETAKNKIRVLRDKKVSFYIQVAIKKSNKIIFSFEDIICKRGKVSGPVLNINKEIFSENFIRILFKKYFEPMFQGERYLSKFQRQSEIVANCEFNFSKID